MDFKKMITDIEAKKIIEIVKVIAEGYSNIETVTAVSNVGYFILTGFGFTHEKIKQLYNEV